jgi:hypothetical protein
MPPACASQGLGRVFRETINSDAWAETRCCCDSVRLYGQMYGTVPTPPRVHGAFVVRAAGARCPRTRAFERSMPGRCQRVAHCAWRGGKTITRTRQQCALRGARKQPCVRARLGRDALALPRRLLLLCVAVAGFVFGTAQLARCRSCPARRVARRLMGPSRCCAGGPVACARRDGLVARQASMQASVGSVAPLCVRLPDSPHCCAGAGISTQCCCRSRCP